jgi:type IV pilus assembly protein PilA
MRGIITQQSGGSRSSEKGFTLIELLIVIVILGILAAIAAFAVAGIANKGQDAACDVDKRAVEVAEETYYARNATYAGEGNLVSSYLREQSDLWNVTVAGTGASAMYSLTPQDPDGAGPQAAACNP